MRASASGSHLSDSGLRVMDLAPTISPSELMIMKVFEVRLYPRKIPSRPRAPILP